MAMFLSPAGAHADVKELEYISSLHQTQQDHLRHDGSIDAQDISLFLLSRHGIQLDPEYIQKRVLDDAPCLDLLQVLCLLLVPHLLSSQHTETTTNNNADTTDSTEKKDLVNRVFGMIQRETNIQGVMTKEKFRDVLEIYGEFTVEDDVIEEMLSSLGSVFTAEAFRNVLIGDVEPYYSIKWKDRVSSHYDDVRLHSPGQDCTENEAEQNDDGFIPSGVVIRESKRLMEHLKGGTVRTFQKLSSHHNRTGFSEHYCDDHQVDNEDHEASTPMLLPHRVFTAPALDQVADTYRSLPFVNLLWITFVVIYLSYLWQIEDGVGTFGMCKITDKAVHLSFPCLVANGISRWLMIFFQLSIIGTTFIALASLGNDAYQSNRCHSIGYTLLGMVTIFMFTTFTYIYAFDAYFIDTTTERKEYSYIHMVSLAMGIVLNIFQFVRLLRLVYPDPNLKWVDNLLTPSIAKAESHTKKAAVFKVSRLVANALAMHHNYKSHHDGAERRSASQGVYATAMLNFILGEGLTIPTGGLWWAWKRYWSGAIGYEDGVWIHSRLVASNLAQWFICFAILFGGGFAIKWIAETIIEQAEDVSNTNYGDIQVWQYTAALFIGLAVGFPAAVWVTLVYIPSFISTVMCFRTGARPSLKDPDFLRHRYSEDNATLLFGCALWGALFTGVISMLVVAGLFFLFFWEQSRNRALTVLAQVIGICVTYTLKIIILLFLRSSFFRAFYRTRPAASNIMGVVLECWNLGLSPGFIAARAGQILGLGILYIGRMDTDFLAKGVASFGPLSLDNYSLTFRKDLLLHEAHRHPYIERLGTMYMLKIRYGKAFLTRAGNQWRILFTLVLMPWMRKYRLLQLPPTQRSERDITETKQEMAGERRALQTMMSDRRMNQYPTREEYLESQNEHLRGRNAALLMKLAFEQSKNLNRRKKDESSTTAGSPSVEDSFVTCTETISTTKKSDEDVASSTGEEVTSSTDEEVASSTDEEVAPSPGEEVASSTNKL